MTREGKPIIGILGGMGPLAGVHLAQMLISVAAERKNIQCDQDQVPFILWSLPDIPDRSRAALDPSSPDPLIPLTTAANGLAASGADVIAIGCNAAHIWHSKLTKLVRVPVLHIVDASMKLLTKYADASRVGVLATDATLQFALYQSALERNGYQCFVPTDRETNDLLMPAIRFVKQNRILEALPLAIAAYEALVERGANAVILGCTELPLLFERSAQSWKLPTIDCTRALASACLDWVESSKMADSFSNSKRRI